ncbi:MAG: hypothetical protein KF749_01230 [Bacteroidetes bacterium]|nr:hypothetical protein [Bacteroidota bacterium]MCW5896135.1 hypothetical protein [Bacteroidota bacterium]
MLRFHSVVVLTILFFPHLSAGQPELSGRFAIQQDLFASSNPNAGFGTLNLQNQESARKKKSVGLAALYSLLLPGLGEYYADGFSSGKYFSIAEGALWLTYITFDVYGASLKDDAIRFAAANAGIDPIGKDDQFFIDIGNFLNTAEFDEKRNRERDPQRTYGNRAGYAWNWGPAESPQSDINRALYKDQRVSGENMLNNRKFVVAAIVINHVASAINAARIAISYNREIRDELTQYQFKADVLGGFTNPHGVLLTVSRNF